MGNTLAPPTSISVVQDVVRREVAPFNAGNDLRGNEALVGQLGEELPGLTSRIQLHLSCSEPVDAVVCLHESKHQKAEWQQLGPCFNVHTGKNPNPHTHAPPKLLLLFKLEVIQIIRVDVYTGSRINEEEEQQVVGGEDSSSTSKGSLNDSSNKAKVLLGSITCSLAELVRAPGRTLTRLVTKDDEEGLPLAEEEEVFLSITAEEHANQNASLRVKLKGENLAGWKADAASSRGGGGRGGGRGGGASSPLPSQHHQPSRVFLRINRTATNNLATSLVLASNDGGAPEEKGDDESAASPPTLPAPLQKVPIHKTEAAVMTIKGGVCCWESFEVSMSHLCKGDVYRPIIVDVVEWSDEGPRLLGEVQTTGYTLLKAGSNATLSILQHPPARLVLQNAQLISRPSFLEYIGGGCSLSVVYAIDFTSSNGDPKDPSSLHYIHPQRLNQYQAAMATVHEVLAPYTRNRFPVFGFGASLKQHTHKHTRSYVHDDDLEHNNLKISPVSNAFACNGNLRQPKVVGLEGLLGAYEQALEEVTLSPPRVFSQVISQVARLSSEYHRVPDQKFFVLVLLTNGVSEDMDSVINEIIRASSLPLSILMVGVGEADFKPLQQQLVLKDGARLRNARSIAARHPVQFVALKDLIKKTTTTAAAEGGSLDIDGLDKEALAKALLQQLPRDLCEYMQMHKIPPQPQRRRASTVSVSNSGGISNSKEEGSIRRSSSIVAAVAAAVTGVTAWEK